MLVDDASWETIGAGLPHSHRGACSTILPQPSAAAPGRRRGLPPTDVASVQLPELHRLASGSICFLPGTNCGRISANCGGHGYSYRDLFCPFQRGWGHSLLTERRYMLDTSADGRRHRQSDASGHN